MYSSDKIKFPEAPEAPYEHWFKIVERLAQKRGEIPSPSEIEAAILIKAAGIPSGPYSAIETPITEETKKRNEIIARYLTDKPGVIIRGKTEKGESAEIISFDFRDMYPNGLPEELKQVLDPRTLGYIEAEYRHLNLFRKKRIKINKIYDKYECIYEPSIYYFRLPGGIDLFLRGYSHVQRYQQIHGKFLKEANKFAEVICIESSWVPFDENLDFRWSLSPDNDRSGDYDFLMREAVDGGFNGLFTVVDAREIIPNMNSCILEKRNILYDFDPKIEKRFFQVYFEYLKNKFPYLMKEIKSVIELKFFLDEFTRYEFGTTPVFYKKRLYLIVDYFHKNYDATEIETPFEKTFFGFGKVIFSDALAAIKLHLIGKLMADGYIKKGPIVNYIGYGHLTNLEFFLRYPQYAMEIVLRTIHHLFEGKIKEIPEVYEVFKNPNKEEVVKQIFKLIFKKPEEDSSKSVEVGANQRKLEDVNIDFLKIYGLNPQKILPSDEEIKRIRKKLIKTFKK